MAILKIGPYLGSRCPQSKNKPKFDPLGVERGICATSGTLANGQVSCPNMAILTIGPYLGNRCPKSENKLNIDPLGWKENICATSGILAND